MLVIAQIKSISVRGVIGRRRGIYVYLAKAKLALFPVRLSAPSLVRSLSLSFSISEYYVEFHQ